MKKIILILIVINTYFILSSQVPDCEKNYCTDIDWTNCEETILSQPPGYIITVFFDKREGWCDEDLYIREIRITSISVIKDPNYVNDFPETSDLLPMIYDYFFKRLKFIFAPGQFYTNCCGISIQKLENYYKFFLTIRMPKCWECWVDLMDENKNRCRPCPINLCCIHVYECCFWKEYEGSGWPTWCHRSKCDDQSDEGSCPTEPVLCSSWCGYHYDQKNDYVLIEEPPSQSISNVDQIDSENYLINFMMSPNGIGTINISSINESSASTNFQLFDFFGRMIYQKDISFTDNTKSLSFELSGIINGIYFYKIYDKNHNFKTGSFIYYK